MGLFDYIRCKMPLPAESVPPKIEWMQTKDTPDQCMSRYTITEDGRLVCEDQGEVTDVHGDIEMYEHLPTGEGWEYTARFTDGRCARIWLREYAPPRSPGL